MDLSFACATRARQLSGRNRWPANTRTNEASTHDQRVLAAFARDRRGLGLLWGRGSFSRCCFSHLRCFSMSFFTTCRPILSWMPGDSLSWMPGGWRHRPEVNTVPRQGHSSAREREGGCLHLLSLGATAEPKTKRKWPAVPRATRTKRKIPAAGRSRYALPSRRIQHREGRIIRETKDRREQREANKCRKEERRIRRQCPAFDS
jgi:hypothetical protein